MSLMPQPGSMAGVLPHAVLFGAAGALLVQLKALAYWGAPEVGLQSVQYKYPRLDAQRAGSEPW